MNSSKAKKLKDAERTLKRRLAHLETRQGSARNSYVLAEISALRVVLRLTAGAIQHLQEVA